MKKVLMLVVVVMAALSVSAQDIRLGGGISLWRNDDADLTSFSITPEIGVELNSKWEIGGELGFAHAKVEKEHYTVKTLQVLLSLRSLVIHSMKIRLFACSLIWEWDSLQ